jgi:ketosteroid isomerase-like protein
VNRCATDLSLERYLLDELELADEREHIARCAHCQAMLVAKRTAGDAYMASPAARKLSRVLSATEPLRVPPKKPRERWLVGALAVGAVAIVLVTLWPRPAADAREAEVLAVEHAWMEAYLHDDAAALDAILANNYTLTDSTGGVSTKADDLANTRTHRVHFDAYDTSEIHVRVWGDTAVVTGRSRIRGSASGRAFAHDITFTDTLAHIDGHWRAVAAHVSRTR